MSAALRSLTRLPLVTVTIVTVCLFTSFSHDLQGWVIYDRARLLSGEFWRLWTGNLVHISTSHLFYDLLAFGIAGSLIERTDCRLFGWLCVLAAGAIGAAVFIWQPEVRFYCGASGLAIAAIVFLALHGAARPPERSACLWRWICVVALSGVCAKITFELKTGRYLFLSDTSEVSVCPLSHVAGALMALVVFAIKVAGTLSRPRRKTGKAVYAGGSAPAVTPKCVTPNCGQRIVLTLVLICPAQFLTGCMTHGLWSGELVESFHEPSIPNNLALFEAPGSEEIIVQYGELSPWRDGVTRRTYLLHENWPRIQARHKPHFASAAITTNATPIPTPSSIDAATNTSATNAIFAVTPTPGNFFTIFRTSASAEGPYQLPSYQGTTGELKLIALTPLAVTADISIVGGVLGYIYLSSLVPGSNR